METDTPIKKLKKTHFFEDTTFKEERKADDRRRKDLDEKPFHDVHIYIVEKGIGKVQISILKDQIASRGGIVDSFFSSQTNHIIALAYDYAQEAIHFQKIPNRVEIHTPSWIIDHIKTNTQLRRHEPRLSAPMKSSITASHVKMPNPPSCEHGLCKLKYVKKEGRHFGLPFWCCSRKHQKCTFFQWLEEPKRKSTDKKRRSRGDVSYSELSTQDEPPEKKHKSKVHPDFLNNKKRSHQEVLHDENPTSTTKDVPDSIESIYKDSVKDGKERSSGWLRLSEDEGTGPSETKKDEKDVQNRRNHSPLVYSSESSDD